MKKTDPVRYDNLVEFGNAGGTILQLDAIQCYGRMKVCRVSNYQNGTWLCGARILKFSTNESRSWIDGTMEQSLGNRVLSESSCGTPMYRTRCATAVWPMTG